MKAHQDGLVDEEDASIRLEIDSRRFLDHLKALEGDVSLITQA